MTHRRKPGMGLRNTINLPNTRLGWARYYEARANKDKANTQAAQLANWYYYLHFEKDAPLEVTPIEVVMAEVVQDQFDKCTANYGYLRDMLADHIRTIPKEQLRQYYDGTFQGAKHDLRHPSQRSSLPM
jgi:hypothetical protein